MSRISAATLLFIIFASSAHGATIRLVTSATATVPPGYSDQDQDTFVGTLTPNTVWDMSSAASGVFAFSNSVTEHSASGYSVLRTFTDSIALGANASADGTTSVGANNNASSGGLATGVVEFSDQLGVFDGPAAGSLLLNFAIAGTVSTFTDGNSNFANVASASGVFWVNGNANPNNVLTVSAHTQNGPGGDTGDKVLTFPATWSALIPYSNSLAQMSLHLGASVNSSNICFPATPAGSFCQDAASALLGNTFTLAFIQVLDSNGVVVPDAYVEGSGITYKNTSSVNAVPEPGSLLLFGFGVAAVTALRRRSL